MVYLNPCVCFTTDVKAAKDPYQVAGYFVLQIVYSKQQNISWSNSSVGRYCLKLDPNALNSWQYYIYLFCSKRKDINTNNTEDFVIIKAGNIAL